VEAADLGSHEDGWELPLHILSDYDDTIQQGWMDSRYKEGTVFPGVLAFLEALRNRVIVDPSEGVEDDDERKVSRPQLPQLTPDVLHLQQDIIETSALANAQTFADAALSGEEPRADDGPRHIGHDFLDVVRKLRTKSINTGKHQWTRSRAAAKAMLFGALRFAERQGGPVLESAIARRRVNFERRRLRSLDREDQFESVPYIPEELDTESDLEPEESMGVHPNVGEGKQPFVKPTRARGSGDGISHKHPFLSVRHSAATSEEVVEKCLSLLDSHHDAVHDSTSSSAQAASQRRLPEAASRLARASTGRGDLTIITARPAGFGGLVKRMTTAKIAALGIPQAGVLCGTMLHAASHSSIAAKKIENAERTLLLFPEAKFIFLGDSGQADAAVGTHLLLEHPEVVKGAFIHNVTPDSDRTGDGRSKDHHRAAGVSFFDSYAGAALEAHAAGLMTSTEAASVIRATMNDLKVLIDEERDALKRAVYEQRLDEDDEPDDSGDMTAEERDLDNSFGDAVT